MRLRLLAVTGVVAVVVGGVSGCAKVAQGPAGSGVVDDAMSGVLTIAPIHVVLAVGNEAKFTSAGGAGSRSFSIASGGGTIDSATGAFKAPGSVGATTIRVTDEAGTVAEAVVVIEPALAITPSSKYTVIGSAVDFDGTGGVLPYRYEVVSGGGSIEEDTGAFTAANDPGLTVVRLIDAYGNQAESKLTVHHPLELLPSSAVLALTAKKTFIGQGGVAPLRYSVVSGGGWVDPKTGVFNASPNPGTSVVQVKDAAGNVRTSTVRSVNVLTIDPPSRLLNLGGLVGFTAAGGIPPYAYTLASGPGSLSKSGIYTAPSALAQTTFSAVVQVRDSGGQSSQATITLIKPVQISAGMNFACARFSHGGVKCWGSNRRGKLGLGDTAHRGDRPGEMGMALPWVNLGTGRSAQLVRAGGEHACALLDNGRIKCWGRSNDGQLGYGDERTRGDDPGETGDALPYVDLGVGRKAVSMSSGPSHNCAILDDGNVRCWGYNNRGQLGYGDEETRGDDEKEMGDRLPVVNLGGRRAVQISCGERHTCATLDDGSVKCWGGNQYGQLGIGNDDDQGDDRGEMAALPSVDLGRGRKSLQVIAAQGHSCALLDNWTVKCWGRNFYGQLGQGHDRRIGDDPNEMGDRLPAVNLYGHHAIGIRAYGAFTCALLQNGNPVCWGAGDYGQLGRGSTSTIGDEPNEMGGALVPVRLGKGFVGANLSLGENFSCAIAKDSRIKCWGRGSMGQLGQGNSNELGESIAQLGDLLPPLAF